MTVVKCVETPVYQVYVLISVGGQWEFSISQAFSTLSLVVANQIFNIRISLIIQIVRRVKSND